jgi:hypothetical protein
MMLRRKKVMVQQKPYVRECNSCMMPAVAKCKEGLPFCEAHLKEHCEKVKHVKEGDGDSKD